MLVHRIEDADPNHRAHRHRRERIGEAVQATTRHRYGCSVSAPIHLGQVANTYFIT